jgi:hypothetical protein
MWMKHCALYRVPEKKENVSNELCKVVNAKYSNIQISGLLLLVEDQLRSSPIGHVILKIDHDIFVVNPSPRHSMDHDIAPAGYQGCKIVPVKCRISAWSEVCMLGRVPFFMPGHLENTRHISWDTFSEHFLETIAPLTHQRQGVQSPRCPCFELRLECQNHFLKMEKGRNGAANYPSFHSGILEFSTYSKLNPTIFIFVNKWRELVTLEWTEYPKLGNETFPETRVDHRIMQSILEDQEMSFYWWNIQTSCWGKQQNNRCNARWKCIRDRIWTPFVQETYKLQNAYEDKSQESTCQATDLTISRKCQTEIHRLDDTCERNS